MLGNFGSFYLEPIQRKFKAYHSQQLRETKSHELWKKRNHTKSSQVTAEWLVIALCAKHWLKLARILIKGLGTYDRYGEKGQVFPFVPESIGEVACPQTTSHVLRLIL